MSESNSNVSAAGPRQRVGIVGLGEIGGAVTQVLLRAGWDVAGLDPRSEVFEDMPGLKRAASPVELAEETDVVLVAVYDDLQLRSVVAAEGDGLLAATNRPIIVVLSTVTLETLRWVGSKASESGVTLIDCGVTGGSGLKRRGKIVVLAGGTESAIETVRPVLEEFADPLLHMGPFGAGMQAKLVRNLMHYSGWHAAWEAAQVAVACGIDVEKLIDAHTISNINSSGGALSLLTAGIRPGLGDGENGPDQELRQRYARYANKDLRYVMELACELGIRLKGAELVREEIPEIVGLKNEENME